MSKGFDVEKSNVSAEMKALFQQTSTRASKVTAVPGIGGVTADKLKVFAGYVTKYREQKGFTFL